MYLYLLDTVVVALNDWLWQRCCNASWMWVGVGSGGGGGGGEGGVTVCLTDWQEVLIRGTRYLTSVWMYLFVYMQVWAMHIYWIFANGSKELEPKELPSKCLLKDGKWICKQEATKSKAVFFLLFCILYNEALRTNESKATATQAEAVAVAEAEAALSLTMRI